jgi:putative membrane protein
MTARRPKDAAPDFEQQLANDRTLLAWVRTAITLAALGYVVARFGLSLRQLRGQTDVITGHSSRVIGVGLVCLGAVVMLFGLIQHWYVRRVLARAGDLPAAPRWPTFVTALGCLTAILVLTVYLGTEVH